MSYVYHICERYLFEFAADLHNNPAFKASATLEKYVEEDIDLKEDLNKIYKIFMNSNYWQFESFIRQNFSCTTQILNHDL